MSEERWLPVVGFEGVYEVSDLGRVRSLERFIDHKIRGRVIRWGTMLKLHFNPSGYWRVTLHRGRSQFYRLVHRMVLEAFVGQCPEGWECRHLNGVRTDARLENLCWGTKVENAADRDRHGRRNPPRGEISGTAKLNRVQVRQIRELRSEGMLTREIAVRFGVSRPTVSVICSRKTWAWLDAA